MLRSLSNYITSYLTQVLCGVVYLCQFDGSLECIYMGYFGTIIHLGFGDGSGGPAVKKLTWGYPTTPFLCNSLSGHFVYGLARHFGQTC